MLNSVSLEWNSESKTARKWLFFETKIRIWEAEEYWIDLRDK